MDTKKLRQKILDLAIHGKLVPQDPNDEPASVLLERIRAEKERLISEGKIKRSRKTVKTADMHHYENVPFEVPESWEWTSGKDLFLPMQSCKPQGENFQYIDIDSINNKKNTIDSPKQIATKKAPSRATRYTRKGDVLFSMVRPYLRNIALITDNEYIASTGFYVCSPTKAITSKYCLYLMLSDYVVNGLNQFMKGDNSPSINNQHITSWLYPLPPLPEQKRIVAEIECWFALIHQIEQGKADLQTAIKQTKSKILDLAIHGKLVPQDPNDEPASELLKRINPKAEITCDNEHSRKLPYNWSCISHNSIIELSGGSQPPKRKFINKPTKGYIRLFQIRDYGKNPLPVYIPNVDAVKQTHKGDILLARYGGSLGKVFIAENGAYNVAMTKVIFKQPQLIDKMFAFFYYHSRVYQDKLKEISRTAQAGFNSGDFEDLYFPLPPLAEQKRIVRKIEDLFTLINIIEMELAE